MLELIKTGEVEFLAPPAVEKEHGVRVAFTGRRGGVSGGPFESLNLSFNVGDERGAVADNRSRLGESIGLPPRDWVLCQQVHGSSVREVGRLEKGMGGRDFWSAMPRTDGLVTSSPGIAIAVLVADCLPVVLTAPMPAVGVAHAGWRGVMSGVAVAAMRKLAGLSRCEPSDITVLIGPHIRPCCFEVGDEPGREFLRRFGAGVVSGRGGGPWKVDLASACAIDLTSAGVRSDRIFASQTCTACGQGYFSHRASGGRAGRQAGIALIG